MEELADLTTFLPIDDPSRVAQMRRLAAGHAREEGLDDDTIAKAQLIATEMATNLLKHAQKGEIHVTRLSGQGTPGLDIVSIDRGPGIANLEYCLRDGYSSAGTAGTGLGALARISQVFDAYSESGKGTVMLARLGGPSYPVGHQDGLVVGFAGRPVSGEEISGDSWGMRQEAEISLFIVADGLGHGLAAAQASQEAVSAFRTSPETEPKPLLERVHRALRGTRGAAVAIARLDWRERRVRYAGIGNISGVISTAAKTQHMVSHNGTAGHEASRFQEFEYSFPKGASLIMHSDGLATSWNLENYPGLRGCHPSVIGGTLYRDATRLRDDVCVVVTKDFS